MRKLRKNSACALKSPRCTCASVPQNTSTQPSARHVTVSLSDEKNLKSALSISIFRALHKLGERILLAFDHLRIAHQFVKPRLVGQRYHDADKPRRFASLGVRPAEVHERGFAAGDINLRWL